MDILREKNINNVSVIVCMKFLVYFPLPCGFIFTKISETF